MLANSTWWLPNYYWDWAETADLPLELVVCRSYIWFWEQMLQMLFERNFGRPMLLLEMPMEEHHATSHFLVTRQFKKRLTRSHLKSFLITVIWFTSKNVWQQESSWRITSKVRLSSNELPYLLKKGNMSFKDSASSGGLSNLQKLLQISQISKSLWLERSLRSSPTLNLLLVIFLDLNDWIIEETYEKLFSCMAIQTESQNDLSWKGPLGSPSSTPVMVRDICH